MNDFLTQYFKDQFGVKTIKRLEKLGVKLLNAWTNDYKTIYDLDDNGTGKSFDYLGVLKFIIQKEVTK